MANTLAFLLPGQGAQVVGMGRAFYDRFEESREIYKRANANLGFDLAALCFEGPLEELTKTERCQPALFVTSVAAFAAFHTISPSFRPVGASGLSLGELTALTVADALRFSDGLYLVRARADAMADCAAHNPGTMLAVVGLSREALDEICRQLDVVCANFNAPDQVVLSGRVSAIEQAEQLARAKGAKRAVQLEVGGAFHSPLMQPAATKFRQALGKVDIKAPSFPVISNVTGQPAQNPDDVRELLVKQIVSPVLWEPSMRRLVQDGATTFLEFPPARVLTGLLRQIDRSAKAIPINEPADLDKLTDLLKATV